MLPADLFDARLQRRILRVACRHVAEAVPYAIEPLRDVGANGLDFFVIQRCDRSVSARLRRWREPGSAVSCRPETIFRWCRRVWSAARSAAASCADSSASICPAASITQAVKQRMRPAASVRVSCGAALLIDAAAHHRGVEPLAVGGPWARSCGVTGSVKTCSPARRSFWSAPARTPLLDERLTVDVLSGRSDSCRPSCRWRHGPARYRPARRPPGRGRGR